jgi:hypothetical protein
MQTTPYIKTASLIGILALVSLGVWLFLRDPSERRAGSPVVAVESPEESAGVADESPDGMLTAERAAPSAQKSVTGLFVTVQDIIGLESNYFACARQVEALGRDLSAEDVAALRSFLLLPSSEFPRLPPIALNSIKNDLLEVLMNQINLPEGLGEQVVNMFNDPNSDYMWREYCLQFLQPFYERIEAENLDDPSVARYELDLIREALFSALDERDKDLAGTALLGLNRLSKRSETLEHSEVVRTAVEIAEDPNASARCRLTAMRVVALDGNADILPVARELAVNGATDLLRGAAITTLGDFADLQDRAFLETVAVSDNRQLSGAARAALARMEKTP